MSFRGFSYAEDDYAQDNEEDKEGGVLLRSRSLSARGRRLWVRKRNSPERPALLAEYRWPGRM
jgi:hypothetical protein